MDEEVYRRLKQIARGRRRAPAEMVREAVAEYTARHAPRRKPRNVGAFKSGRRDLGQRARRRCLPGSMIVVDTGAMLALLDVGEDNHPVIKALYSENPDAWVLPWAILPEVDYLVSARRPKRPFWRTWPTARSLLNGVAMTT